MTTTLDSLFDERGIVREDIDGLRAPRAFADAAAERASVTEAAGIVDHSGYGLVSVDGPDARAFLHRLASHDFKAASSGDALETVFLTGKGRILHHGIGIVRGDDVLLVRRAPGSDGILALLDRYHFSEDLEFASAEESFGVITILGSGAASIASHVLGVDASSIEAGKTATSGETTVVRIEPIAGEAFLIVSPRGDLGDLWRKLEEAGARPVGQCTFDDLRIEAGVPAEGTELDEDANPLEAGLWRAVRFDKGCYVGQEVVARLNTYDKVSRHCVRLSFDEGADPSLGSLRVDGREVGRVTSVASSPVDGRVAALGYLKKAHAEAGTEVTGHANGDEGGVSGRVEHQAAPSP